MPLTPTVLVTLVAAALALVTPARGEVYKQLSDFPPGGSALASMWVRQGDDPAFAAAYDDFTLSGPATITGVKWHGGYFLPPTQVPIFQFTVTFYSTNPAGEPDTVGSWLNQTVAPGTAGETYLGTTPGMSPVRVYDYGLTLTTPFSASAGTKYWLSIVPDTQGASPEWGWLTGTGGNGVMFEELHHVRSWYPSDLAFILVPEPSSLVGLLSAGALGLAAYGWRRRRHAKLA